MPWQPSRSFAGDRALFSAGNQGQKRKQNDFQTVVVSQRCAVGGCSLLMRVTVHTIEGLKALENVADRRLRPVQ